jgi:hypothetical protein
MAKTKGPLFSVSASGALGQKIIYGQSVSGSTARKMRAVNFAPITENPTPAQVAQRALYSAAAAFWQTMTAPEREAYTQAAQAARITLYNAFLRDYLLNGPPVPALVPAVWDSADHDSAISIESAGRVARLTSFNWTWLSARAQGFHGTGKHNFEQTASGNIDQRAMVAVADAAASLSTYFGQDAHSYSYQAQGYCYHNGAYYSVPTFGPSDVISVEADLDGHTIEFFKNNDSVMVFSGVGAGPWAPGISLYNVDMQSFINCGQDAWTRTPGAGYNGWSV